MLCQICSSFDINKVIQPERNWAGRHKFQDSFEALSVSANNGCEFCSLVDREFEKKITPEDLQKYARKQTFIARGSMQEPYFAENSSLWAWCGDRKGYNTLVIYPVLVVFSLCIPRSTKEWDTGCVDGDNPGSELFSGRPLCRSPSSDQCFDIARSWLDLCMREHGAHSPHIETSFPARDYGDEEELLPLREGHGLSTFMPTRTINVGRKSQKTEPFLEIHDQESINAEAKPWVALSHSWGGKSAFILKTDNLEEWKRCIGIASMPRTFQDAVQITRELGIKNLWIDSVCIVQDSEQDWAFESARMGDIYRHSMVHVAAHASDNCDAGIYEPRPTEVNYVSVPFQSGRFHVSGQVLVRPALQSLDFSLSKNGSILSSRGWVLQESLLAPRTLHFGSQQISWECPNRVVSEGEMEPSPKFSKGSKELDWHFNKRFLFSPVKDRELGYRAPTWSWASTVGPVEFSIRLTRTAELAPNHTQACYRPYLPGT